MSSAPVELFSLWRGGSFILFTATQREKMKKEHVKSIEREDECSGTMLKEGRGQKELPSLFALMFRDR
jgi:hypothetical protein